MRITPLILIPLVALAGCDQGPVAGPGGHHGGRYLGIGTYVAGRLWSRQANVAAPSDPAAATIADDEQIVVTVDSQTGEVRQCGNLSGHCVVSNPWAGRSAPANLSQHAADLDRETLDADVAANAVTNAPH